MDNAKKMGQYLRRELEKLKSDFSFIKKIRGMALMLGVELTIDGTKIYEECFKRNLLINCTQGNILRIMPPLVVTKDDIDRAIYILKESLKAAQ